MENIKKENRIGLALLLSMLTALVGGVLFGVIYGLGYYVYILSALEIMLSLSVFFRFVKKPNWKYITLSIIWCFVGTFVFNFLAVVVCEVIWVMLKLNCSFKLAFEVVIDLWKNDASIKAYFNKRMLQIFGMIAIAGAIYGVSFIVALSKKKTLKTVNQPSVENNTKTTELLSNKTVKTSTENPMKIGYNYLLSRCSEIIHEFVKTKDNVQFKESAKLLQINHINNFNEEQKQNLLILVTSALAKENITTLDKKANELLLKLIK